MKTYEVILTYPATQVYTYHIEANSEADAIDIALQGDEDPVDYKVDDELLQVDASATEVRVLPDSTNP